MTNARREGFTFVELVVTVSICGLLISLIVPAIQYARASADRLSCQSGLRQIGIALHHRQATYGQMFPTSISTSNANRQENILSWMASILPEIEQDTLYVQSERACALNINPFKNPPHTGLATVVRLYVCPTDSRLYAPVVDKKGVEMAYTSYIGLASVFQPSRSRLHIGLFAMQKPSLDGIRDGSSNTVIVSERPPPDPPLAGWWYSGLYADVAKCHGPNTVIHLGYNSLSICDKCYIDERCLGPGKIDNPCDRHHLWSLHPGGANFLFADTSVRFLRYSADPIIPALISVSGGEIVELPD